MTSYIGSLNNLLSTTTSRYNSLRRNLLSNSSEDDTNVDHADATHVSRVLRAYYTEKHLPLPGWLPPDPYKPPPTTGSQSYVSSRPLGSLRSASSNPSNPTTPYDPPPSSNANPARSSGLGDIWGDQPTIVTPQQPQNEGSLRRTAAMGASRRPGAPQWASSNQGQSGGLEVRGERRPLPSQRVGSYQSVNRYADEEGGGSRPGSAASAVSSSGRDRLKARMGSQRAGGMGGRGGAATGGGGEGDGGSYYGR